MTIETRFPSLAAMERIIATGLEEGLASAIGQMDDIVVAADRR